MPYTKEMKLQVVRWYIRTSSITEVQRKFCSQYRNGLKLNYPSRESILLWYDNVMGML